MPAERRFDLAAIQKALSSDATARAAGWLFYDFRGLDPISLNILCFPADKMATRRWFYWVPASGEPVKVAHRIEADALDHLPGRKLLYSGWKELEAHLKTILKGVGRVAMQYSPMNAIPYVSRVDAGTVELIRSFGVEVVSSADLVQMFEAVWSDEQLETHLYAAKHMRDIVDLVFKEVGRRVREGVGTNEVEIQDFLWKEFERRDLTAGHKPIVAINEHSADPHFAPNLEDNYAMKEGDFLLIDMWTKRRVPHAVYDDITWTGFIGKTVPSEHENIFNIVRNGRDAAIRFAEQNYPGSGTLFGWQVDNAARQSITQAGYGEYFIHRTGHSIHEEVHGNGANIDGLETQDQRRLMARTCFSIEPGVYLKGKFGVRSEIDMYLSDEKAIVTGLPVQTHVLPILNL